MAHVAQHYVNVIIDPEAPAAPTSAGRTRSHRTHGQTAGRLKKDTMLITKNETLAVDAAAPFADHSLPRLKFLVETRPILIVGYAAARVSGRS